MNAENSISKILRLVRKEKNVLDVGCANGYLSEALREQLNCSVTGVEIDSNAAKEARKYCNRVIVGDIENENVIKALVGERFDIIIFGDLLEHLKYPTAVLKAVRPLLTDSGYILASIPNIAHISVALDLLEGNFEYRSSGILDDTHIRFFTKKSILSMFKEAGYEICVWDRVIMKPEDTEFKTKLSNYPYSLLSFFQPSGDSLTYQFIVKAISYSKKKNLDEQISESEKWTLRELRDTVVGYEKKLAKRDRRLAEQERKLGAILNSYSWKITAPLRSLYNILRRK